MGYGGADANGGGDVGGGLHGDRGVPRARGYRRRRAARTEVSWWRCVQVEVGRVLVAPVGEVLLDRRSTGGGMTAKARHRALACGSLHGGQGGSLVPPHTR